MKICTKCKKDKDENKFGEHKKGKNKTAGGFIWKYAN